MEEKFDILLTQTISINDDEMNARGIGGRGSRDGKSNYYVNR